MSEQKPKIFEQIKNKIEEKKYDKEIKKIEAWIEDIKDDDEGFLVSYELDQESFQTKDKRISKQQFEGAFHQEVWNNMMPQEQIVSLIWFDEYLAKKQNREPINFVIDKMADTYFLKLIKSNVAVGVPIYLFETSAISSYLHAEKIIQFGIMAKIFDRIYQYEQNNKIIDLDENQLEDAKVFVYKPRAYNKLIIQKAVEQLDEQEKAYFKNYLAPLTKQEKNHILLYLLQPCTEEINLEVKELMEMGERNVFYLGEDYTFEQYQSSLTTEKRIEQEFLEEETAGMDKKKLFKSLFDIELKNKEIVKEAQTYKEEKEDEK